MWKKHEMSSARLSLFIFSQVTSQVCLRGACRRTFSRCWMPRRPWWWRRATHCCASSSSCCWCTCWALCSFISSAPVTCSPSTASSSPRPRPWAARAPGRTATTTTTAAARRTTPTRPRTRTQTRAKTTMTVSKRTRHNEGLVLCPIHRIKACRLQLKHCYQDTSFSILRPKYSNHFGWRVHGCSSLMRKFLCRLC